MQWPNVTISNGFVQHTSLITLTQTHFALSTFVKSPRQIEWNFLSNHYLFIQSRGSPLPWFSSLPVWKWFEATLIIFCINLSKGHMMVEWTKKTYILALAWFIVIVADALCKWHSFHFQDTIIKIHAQISQKKLNWGIWRTRLQCAQTLFSPEEDLQLPSPTGGCMVWRTGHTSSPTLTTSCKCALHRWNPPSAWCHPWLHFTIDFFSSSSAARELDKSSY